MSETEQPTPTDNRLSTVSKQYDLGNKGYLDSTEIKLRQLDTENQGHLDIEKVYQLMQSMEREQKKALTLKRVVIALVAFAVLLALANIGTSFAAAVLAKDTSSSSDGDLYIKGTTTRVRTTPRFNVYRTSLAPPERRLQYDLIGDGGAGNRAPLELTKTDADAIFLDVCGTWYGVATFPCETTSIQCPNAGAYVYVDGCNQGYRWEFAYKQIPYCDNNNNIVFEYTVCRDQWCYGTATITCSRNDAINYCTTSNLPCEKICNMCTTSGGTTRWFCDPSYGCGCAPSECSATSGGSNLQCSTCYDDGGRSGC